MDKQGRGGWLGPRGDKWPRAVPERRRSASAAAGRCANILIWVGPPARQPPGKLVKTRGRPANPWALGALTAICPLPRRRWSHRQKSSIGRDDASPPDNVGGAHNGRARMHLPRCGLFGRLCSFGPAAAPPACCRLKRPRPGQSERLVGAAVCRIDDELEWTRFIVAS